MGIANDLERLAELHRSGALSDAEFASAKARALGETPQAASNAVMHWLHALRRSRTDSWLGGVCGGLAPATGLPAWLVRLIFACSSSAAAPACCSTCCSGSSCRRTTA
jgi:hypothetical protein